MSICHAVLAWPLLRFIWLGRKEAGFSPAMALVLARVFWYLPALWCLSLAAVGCPLGLLPAAGSCSLPSLPRRVLLAWKRAWVTQTGSKLLDVAIGHPGPHASHDRREGALKKKTSKVIQVPEVLLDYTQHHPHRTMLRPSARSSCAAKAEGALGGSTTAGTCGSARLARVWNPLLGQSPGPSIIEDLRLET